MIERKKLKSQSLWSFLARYRRTYILNKERKKEIKTIGRNGCHCIMLHFLKENEA